MSEGHWFYYVRCECCKTVTVVAGPKKENTTWKEFCDILLRSSEAKSQYRSCSNCKIYTLSILIGFDPESEIKTIN